MKAAIVRSWGTPEVFEIGEIQKPVPQDDQLLIKVYASGINPVDWKHRTGNHKYILGSPFPVVLGYDVCGEVVETGNKIRNFKTGDVVFGNLDNKYGGALAEFAVGREHCFVHKPDNISVYEAAGVTLTALTALQALRDKAKLKSGQTVLINGATGGVGHLAVQIAKKMGAKIIAVSSSRNKEFIDRLKPDIFIDYTKEHILESKLKTDLFFDVTGNYSFLKTKHMLNKNGTYVNTLPRPKILFHKLLQPFSNGKKVKTLLRNIVNEDLKTIAMWLENGDIKVEIDKVFALHEVASAHTYSENGHTRGKNIVTINPN